MAQTPSSLRMARHSDKFFHILLDSEFYRPFHIYYEPTEEFLAIVRALLSQTADDWQTVRSGLWYHVRQRHSELPDQGWKIHISSLVEDGTEILERVTKLALARHFSFKFALDPGTLSLMSSKRWDRGGSGKFITIYPRDDGDFRNLLAILSDELASFKGPYILSDRRYANSKVVYYRYGGIAPHTKLEITGQRTPIIFSPSGEQMADTRGPFFSPPVWVRDPYPANKLDVSTVVLNGRYHVKEALSFSNAGGVYVAQDLKDVKQVVVKEARALIAIDRFGMSAADRLKKEAEILAALGESGFAPKFVDSFRSWENDFLVQEYLEGTTLREILITKNPLVKLRASLADSQVYYNLYIKLFVSLLKTFTTLHELGIIFGDVSHNNVKVDPENGGAFLFDFEAAVRLGVDKMADLYTPGYRKDGTESASLATDAYGLSALMLYMLFPLATLLPLRPDLFDEVLKGLIEDLGWTQTPVLPVIQGLAKGQMPISVAAALLESPVTVNIPPASETLSIADSLAIVQELGTYLLDQIARSSGRELCAADPFMHSTNPLGLGFGACGILYSLHKSGFHIPREADVWLRGKLDSLQADSLPPGLLTGSSGIAWSLWEMGYEERALLMINKTNTSPLCDSHPSYLYGAAGIGIANLFFYLKTRMKHFLSAACKLADTLLSSSCLEGDRRYWISRDYIQIGFGYGQSGIALFLLRLSQVTGDDKFKRAGQEALAYDLSHGVRLEEGSVGFPNTPGETTILPYTEEGTAGIAKVAMRFAFGKQERELVGETHRKYSAFPGLLHGLGSFADVLIDAFLLSGDNGFLTMASRPISGIRDLFVIRQRRGAAIPGEGLLRISCDYATGTAGVMRVLYRYAHRDPADFMLDEVEESHSCCYPQLREV